MMVVDDDDPFEEYENCTPFDLPNEPMDDNVVRADLRVLSDFRHEYMQFQRTKHVVDMCMEGRLVLVIVRILASALPDALRLKIFHWFSSGFRESCCFGVEGKNKQVKSPPSTPIVRKKVGGKFSFDGKMYHLFSCNSSFSPRMREF